MRLSEEWIREWVSVPVGSDELCEQLTMAGLEVESNEPVSAHFSGVVVGEVVELAAHPDADRLRVAQVQIGASEMLQIVCGAPNVVVGLKAPVAIVGAVLPGGLKIKKGKLRGVESNGMLCGASEIGLVDEVDGLLELSGDAPVGVDVRDHLGLDEQVIDISITPNRGDCLSVRGIARELAVINELAFDDIKPSEAAYTEQVTASVAVEVDQCPIYVSLHVGKLSGTTSELIKKRLARSGITPRCFAVDLTNYLMIETGQPLHAFDADKLQGGLSVRLAQASETLVLLNEQTVTLTGDELVIADQSGVIALAGIMGGLSTAVDEETQNVLFESAHFDRLAIAGRARRFGLHTDASARFERGVDPQLPEVVMQRLVGLINDQGDSSSVCSPFVHHLWNSKHAPIELSANQVNERLGLSLTDELIEQILTRLGFVLERRNQAFSVLAPSYRFDVEIAEDLIEEVARIYGYDQIPAVEPVSPIHLKPIAEHLSESQIRHTLVALGYFEAISFSFVDEQLNNRFSQQPALRLANPISQDLGVMRTSLLSSLVPCIQHNLNRQQQRIRLFETGLRFEGSTSQDLKQIESLCLVACGPIETQSHHAQDKASFDFYDLKHDVCALLQAAKIKSSDLKFVRSQVAYLHPGQSADILVNDRRIGFMGALHPLVLDEIEIKQLWVAEIDMEPLQAATQIKAQAVSKFPQVKRDLAVIVDESVDVGALLDTATQGDARMTDAWVFDLYRSKELGENLKSVALTLVWQDPERTIEEEETTKAFTGAIERLIQEHGAVLRDS